MNIRLSNLLAQENGIQRLGLCVRGGIQGTEVQPNGIKLNRITVDQVLLTSRHDAKPHVGGSFIF